MSNLYSHVPLVSLLSGKYLYIESKENDEDFEKMYEELIHVTEEELETPVTVSEEVVEKMRRFKLLSIGKFKPEVTRHEYVKKLAIKLQLHGAPLSDEVLHNLENDNYPFIDAYSGVTWNQMCVDGL